MSALETFQRELPHGIRLSVRAAGVAGRPLLMFLHGFPEGAFVWDELLLHFASDAHGGYRCLAPNLRGFEYSSQPNEATAYRAKHLVQDLLGLLASEGERLALLCAHDWGGALAWSFANQHPERIERLAILNSPHPATFLRALQTSPAQQRASEYMNFLTRPDAESLLRENGYARLFGFLEEGGQPPRWLDEARRDAYRRVWDQGLRGGCNYYRASPLRPGPSATGVGSLPRDLTSIAVETLVLWGMKDRALLPELLEGLEDHVPRLRIERQPEASHWIVHEQPEWVIQQLTSFLAFGLTPAAPSQ